MHFCQVAALSCAQEVWYTAFLTLLRTQYGMNFTVLHTLMGNNTCAGATLMCKMHVTTSAETNIKQVAHCGTLQPAGFLITK